MRVIGIDLGTRRIGVAVSDSTGTLASPLSVLARSGEALTDYQRLAAIVAEERAERVVVGLPLSLNGEMGSAARSAAAEAAELSGVLRVPVETFDERLTTVSADRVLRQRNLKAKARRLVVDKVAAAVLLQAWLDAGRATRV